MRAHRLPAGAARVASAAAGCRADPRGRSVRPFRAVLPFAVLALCACAGLSNRPEPGAYAIDPTHTSVTFEVAHFGTSTSRGRFERAQGEVRWGESGQGGRVEIRIATASVSTGVAALDGRLRGRDFLDSEAFPAATFIADGLAFKGGAVSEVAGQLTLRGKTLPLTLKASHFNCYVSPLLVRQVCGGDFEATLQPSRWGVAGGLPIGIADEVRLLVQVEAIRQ